MKLPSRSWLIACSAALMLVVSAATASAQKVLIVASDDSGFVADVQSKLVATHRLSQVDVFDASVATPSIDLLRGYDAVLTWSNDSYLDADALGDVLADYADQHGGVVQAEYAFYSGSPFAELRLAGRWSAQNYAAFTSSDAGMASDPTLVADVPGHPLLVGVTRFDGGQTAFYHAGIAVPDCGQVVAHWSTGEPLVVVGCPAKGHTVGLNFYPVSSDARADFWVASTDGAILLANALAFVSPVSNHAPTASAGSAQTREATGPAGAVFTLAASAADADGDPLTYTWGGAVTASGQTAIVSLPPPASARSQTYVVTLTVTDGKGGQATDSVALTVTDTTGPVFQGLPVSAMTATATGATGAAVSYGPITASDAVDGPRPVVCDRAGIFPIGDTHVTCSAADSRGNTSTASFMVHVADVTTPGHMWADGEIRTDGLRYQFAFDVYERDPRQRANFVFLVRGAHEAEGEFIATTTDFVAFSDDPTVRPGRSNRPQVDTVRFSGMGRWNGHSGYRYDVVGVDDGEPGRRDTFHATITAPGGAVVAQVTGTLAGGNIQSQRLR